ncbi:MAG: FAD-dependent oxidoreductase [Candidatus Latescibacterota bacterium]|nr:FAD-dependent oxidoreductase [Candidatus Latescibacterota bacterium]
MDTKTNGKQIAIIGSGVSGLIAASKLSADWDISLYEQGNHIGGHTNTIDVDHDGKTYSVDTGFIVYNEKNYPIFTEVLDTLGVSTKPTEMSFSVQCQETGLEYNGTSLNKIFSQRSNLLRPSFHRMLREIIRFYRSAPELLEGIDNSTTLGDYLDQGRYSQEFIEQHIIPMGAAIWSASPEGMFDFPARSFAHFFDNHGFLQWKGRPEWRVICGGSKRYVEALIKPFVKKIHTNSPIKSICREGDVVKLDMGTKPPKYFDKVIIATHSDQALKLLSDPTPIETEILSAIRYQKNETTLHTDSNLLPSKKLAWASWNYFLPRKSQNTATVTYNMNILQGIKSPVPFCVSLNRQHEIEESTILKQITYHHPVYDLNALSAQSKRHKINGVNQTYFCGAYWGYGFHEDGARSGIEVAEAIQKEYSRA